MGIIQKQALQTTIISFLGIGIGMASQLIMPFVLETEQIGTLALLNSISQLFAVIFCLGFAQITFLTFADFRNVENGHSGFFALTLIYSFIGFLLGSLFFYLFGDQFVGQGDKYKLIRSVSFLIYPLIFFRIFFTNLDGYMRMLFKTVLGSFLEGFFLKLLILFGILMVWLEWIDFKYMTYLYVIALSAPGIFIIWFSTKNTSTIKLPQKSFLTRSKIRSYLNFGLFGLLGSATRILVVSIDQVMINQMIDTKAVGVYSVLFFAGLLVNLPSRGIKRIALPILSEYWKQKALDSIAVLYEKTSRNQTVISLYLYIVGLVILQPMLTFLPKFEEGYYVFVFIGLGQLLDMLTGLNSDIIFSSKYYKVNSYFNAFLAVIVIGLNFLFIPIWGIIGAALASAASMLILNILRTFYVYRKFNMHPFSVDLLKVIIVGFSIFILHWIIIPNYLSPIADILLSGILITVLYWSIILKMKLAPDINSALQKWIKKSKS